MGMSGIKSLIVLAQTKQQNANEAALEGADKQRALIKGMKDLRAQQRALDDKLLDKKITSGELDDIQDLLNGAGLSSEGLGDISMNANDAENGQHASLGAEGAAKENQDVADAVRNRFQDAIKDLEAQDKLGNFEVQDLMSTFNQAQTLASSVQKKLDDTESAVIGKV